MKTIFYPLELNIRYIKYKGRYKKMLRSAGDLPIIKNTDETLDKILQEHCSMSRYGDGEFEVMTGSGNGFCTYSPFLAEKLKTILSEEIPGHIVGLPYGLLSQKNLRLRTKVFWIAFFCKTFNIWKKYLKPGRIYYNAEVTRFYFACRNKSVCPEYLNKLKQIWEQRDILLIEGEYSRLGVNNDLFNNARSLQRILGPTQNAYTRYADLLKKATETGKDKLILIALGQTATALAYDLAKAGFWAIDIGHLDVEYEWFLRKAKDKVKIEGKHVNEAKYVPTEEKFSNQTYEKQIIAKII